MLRTKVRKFLELFDQHNHARRLNPHLLPPKDLINRLIKILSAPRGYQGIPHDTLKNLLQLLAYQHVLQLFEMKDFHFLRVRSDGVTLFSNISELGALPPEKVKTFGRCNKPGQSMLYTAMDLDTIFSEKELKIGDLAQVIKYRNRDGGCIKTYTIGELAYIAENNHSRLVNKECVQQMLANMPLSPVDGPDRFDTLVKVDIFFARIFSKKHKIAEHRLTSALIDLFVELQPIDCFAYPSVKLGGGLNCAFPLQKMQEKLIVEGCEAYRITNVFNNGFYEYEMTHFSESIAEDGTITWQEVGNTTAEAAA